MESVITAATGYDALVSAATNTFAFEDLADRDPEAAKALWLQLVEEETKALESGNRAFEVLQAYEGPRHRARFLVLRQSYRKQWQPQNGIEDTMLDTLAQAYTMWETYLQIHRQQIFFEGRREKGDIDRDGKWTAPTISTAEALEHSAQMADRWNRLYMRTLRQLRDLRRYPVIINNPKQVNVADKQVNVTS